MTLHSPLGGPSSSESTSGAWHGTTIISVRNAHGVVVAGDGQVSMGSMIVKSNTKKVRLLPKWKVLTGFAGATSDAFALLERLEDKLDKYAGNLMRASVQLSKDWRTDRYLRKLEAMLIVADAERTLMLTGSGDVLEPKDGIAAVGSGGPYALAAARALHEQNMCPQDIARKSLTIAADLCVYTNTCISLEYLPLAPTLETPL